jgi:hypothetical protein
MVTLELALSAPAENVGRPLHGRARSRRAIFDGAVGMHALVGLRGVRIAGLRRGARLRQVGREAPGAERHPGHRLPVDADVLDRLVVELDELGLDEHLLARLVHLLDGLADVERGWRAWS